MDGFAFTNTAKTCHSVEIQSGKSLTVKGETIFTDDLENTYDSNGIPLQTYFVFQNNGTLNIEKLEISSLSVTSILNFGILNITGNVNKSSTGTLVQANASSVVNVENTANISTKGFGFIISSGAALNFSGYLEATANAASVIAILSRGTTNITGGTIKATSTSDAAIGVLASGMTPVGEDPGSEGITNISGGTIEVNGASSSPTYKTAGVYLQGYAQVNVTGGTIKSSNYSIFLKRSNPMLYTEKVNIFGTTLNSSGFGDISVVGDISSSQYQSATVKAENINSGYKFQAWINDGNTVYKDALIITSSNNESMSNLVKSTTKNVFLYVLQGVASHDATLKDSSTVKGQGITTLGTPNTTLGSEVAGSVTINAAQAADISNAGSYVTQFSLSDSKCNAVKVVKYASGSTPTEGTFATDTAYKNEAINNGDFFIVKVVAEDGSTTLYYKIVVTVNAAPSETAADTHHHASSPTKPAAPSVTADDANNLITGLGLATMEYSLDGGATWTQAAGPDLTGNKSVLVRVKAKDGKPASDATNLTFTTNPVKPAAPKVTADDANNKIIGLDLTTMEYSLNGGKTWSQAAGPDLSGDKTVTVRIKAKDGKSASDATALTYTTNPAKPAAPSVKADDANNQIIGLDLATMEYSLDGGKTWIQAAGPDLTGDKTVKVRVKANAGKAAGDATTLTFSINPVLQAAPSVTADDANNVIIGLDLAAMEYSLDGGQTWAQAAGPDLTGDKTVMVRFKAKGGQLAGDATTLTFTTNSGSTTAYSIIADDAKNTIIGLDLATMEYSLDGGKTWTQAADPDLTGNTIVQVRIKAKAGKQAGEATTLTFTTKPAARWLTAGVTVIIIIGLTILFFWFFIVGKRRKKKETEEN